MAVSLEVTIPDVGQYIPLGGDGWTAPHSVWEVSQLLAGDGGGGNSQITINFDERFQSVVSYVNMRNSNASTAVEMLIQILPRNRSAPQLMAFANAVPLLGLTSENLFTWCPPPIVGLGRAISTKVNTSGDTHIFQMYLYNFDINVLQKVPLNLILSSLPRGESQVPITTA